MKPRIIIAIVFSLLIYTNCGDSNKPKKESTKEKILRQQKERTDPLKDKGIGPISSITLGELNIDMAQEGENIFKSKCSACHHPTEKIIGPAPKDILKRRSPEWVMNMILNPNEMVEKNPIAKKLLKEYNGSPMINQNLTEKETRAILEYFRTL